jgi:hypothetical protein
MELRGALSNPVQTDKDLLMRLSSSAVTLRLVSIPLHRRQLPSRAGGIKSAVIETIGEAPLTLKEIHARCERLLGRCVCYATVKDCVHKHTRGSEPIFERIRHGAYRQRS